MAQHFGVTPMALYWHVKNKEELLEAMGDQIFAGLNLPDPTGLSWDEHYRLLLIALLDVLRAHPGSVELAGGRVLHNDAGRDLTELALSLLRGAGLTIQASSDVARTSLQTIRSTATGVTEPVATNSSSPALLCRAPATT